VTTDGATTARHELMARVRDLLKAVRLVKRPPHQTAVPSGTYGVLATISTIESAAGCHSKDLAAECALDPSTISRAVAALVRAGLVLRAADPHDGRASVLALTPQGRAALSELDGWYDKHLADALQDWTVDDIRMFAGFLQRFSNDLIARLDDRRVGANIGRNPTSNPHTILEAAR
jgi:DNA-binding MarR family transcriptional regulator